MRSKNRQKLKNIVYVNGYFVDGYDNHISLMDRGFNLADGIFETMVAHVNRIFSIDDHFERLYESARVLSIDMPAPDKIKSILYESIKQNELEYCVVRLTITRGVDHNRGLEVHECTEPSITVRVVPWDGPATELPRGKKLCFSSVIRNEFSPLSNIKSLSYTEAVIARHEAQKTGFDDALLLNTKHVVTGATSSNVFVVMGGKIITPSLSDGVLPGIARSKIIELCASMDIIVLEKSITKTHIEYSEESFISNVVTGITPISVIEGAYVAQNPVGSLTKRIFEAYRDRLLRELS